MRILQTAVLAASSVSFMFFAEPPLAADLLSERQVRGGFQRHAALTQLHRWYQFYENDAVPIDNQIDILSEDVRLKSAIGESTGHAAYRARVAQIPATSSSNGHAVNSVKAVVGENGSIELNVEVTHFNLGALDGGAMRSAELSYITTLAPADGPLPKFTRIQIEQNSESESDVFVNFYPENRLKSLMHYWLTLIEDPARDPHPVREILADDFALNFSSGAITDFAEFETWLAGPGSQFAASTHTASNFSYRLVADDTYLMNVDFDWQGILFEGSQIVAKTRHTWTVLDQPADRFARINQIDVEVLDPFLPATN